MQIEENDRKSLLYKLNYYPLKLLKGKLNGEISGISPKSGKSTENFSFQIKLSSTTSETNKMAT